MRSLSFCPIPFSLRDVLLICSFHNGVACGNPTEIFRKYHYYPFYSVRFKKNAIIISLQMGSNNSAREK
jgi:uncharacterized membrane protein